MLTIDRFDSVVFAVDCILSSAVSPLFTHRLVTCVLHWYRRILTVRFGRPDVTVRFGRPDVTVRFGRPDVTVRFGRPDVTVRLTGR